MDRRTIIKAVLGLILVVGVPQAGAIGYGFWLDQRAQARKAQRDAQHALIYTIPAGSAKQFRPIQDQALALPTTITLTVGLTDTLRIHNADAAPGRAGPFKIDPGMTYRQQFQEPGKYPFLCDINPANSVTVVVVPGPQ